MVGKAFVDAANATLFFRTNHTESTRNGIVEWDLKAQTLPQKHHIIRSIFFLTVFIFFFCFAQKMIQMHAGNVAIRWSKNKNLFNFVQQMQKHVAKYRADPETYKKETISGFVLDERKFRMLTEELHGT